MRETTGHRSTTTPRGAALVRNTAARTAPLSATFWAMRPPIEWPMTTGWPSACAQSRTSST